MEAAASAVQPEPREGKPRLVYPGLAIPFVLLICCFAAWGAAANLTDVLVGVFRTIFDMSNFQAALVQFAYYGAYFTLAIPAAMINRRFGYKAGVLTGLGLASVGGLLFIPASEILVYEVFLIALFVLAAGLSILETSANPFVIAMGPEGSATQRLNLAQAFNPVGANIGVLLGAVLILPQITSEAAKTIMSPAELEASQEDGPGAGARALPGDRLRADPDLAADRVPQDVHARGGRARRRRARPAAGRSGRLWRNRHYRYGVAAQFFNVAAQVCAWTFTILYAQDVVGVPAEDSGWYLQASLILFLVARFVMTWLLGIFRPTLLLLIMASLGVGFCLVAMFSQNMVGLIAVVCISLSLSLMFPTIYGVALQGLGEDTKFGAAGLVMAILGGAIMPPIQGKVMDEVGAALGFVVPGICLALVGAYALFDLRTRRGGSGQLVAEGAH